MTEAVDAPAARARPAAASRSRGRRPRPRSSRSLQRSPSAPPRRCARPARDVGVVGPPALADLAPSLRPIGAAMVLSGFEPGARSRAATGARRRRARRPRRSRARGRRPTPPPSFAPGDAVGVSLIRGDLEMGATGTVTYVDGSRVYAFGHPFLNLGPTAVRDDAGARLHGAAEPRLVAEDRDARPGDRHDDPGSRDGHRRHARRGRRAKLAVHDHALVGAARPDRQFTFYVLHDQLLTPLFSYVAVLNALTSYRAPGRRDVDRARPARVSFGADGKVDDRRRLHRRQRR